MKNNKPDEFFNEYICREYTPKCDHFPPCGVDIALPEVVALHGVILFVCMSINLIYMSREFKTSNASLEIRKNMDSFLRGLSDSAKKFERTTMFIFLVVTYLESR